MQSRARVPAAGGAGLFTTTRDASGTPGLAEPMRLGTAGGGVPRAAGACGSVEDFGRALAGEPTDKHDSADISF
jgi:hypothetical protein